VDAAICFIGSSLYVVGFLGVPVAILPHTTPHLAEDAILKGTVCRTYYTYSNIWACRRSNILGHHGDNERCTLQCNEGNNEGRR
jgi:hypothetical protein